MTVLNLPQPCLAITSPVALLLYVGILVAVLGLILGLWLALGRGPRRRRAYHRARRLLQQRQWQEALQLAHTLQRQGRLSAAWRGRLGNLEGECHREAGKVALLEKRYEDALKHDQLVAQLLHLDEAEAGNRIVEVMLAEIRRLVATMAASQETDIVHKLIGRVLLIQSPCAEASFWQGLCHVQNGRVDLALNSWRTAHEATDRRFLDPPLYLGALLLREGRPQDALRHLSEANRLDAGCPFVGWQLGSALVAAGGDSGLAVRALQRAIARFGVYKVGEAASQRAWVESFPEGRSFVRRLALKHPFPCPLLGGDVVVMIRQAQLTLAQAQYRLGNFQATADLYTALLQECPPSVPLLRGLGLALVRLERFDEAFKHLRIAYGQEEPKSHTTAGYLALCGALGKAKQPEDKPRNVLWAIDLLGRFNVPGDEHWARLYGRVFAEARSLGLALPAEEQRRLCDLLVSVHAADADAAAAYDSLATAFPDAVRPEHAWLYCWAAQQHGCSGQRDRELFVLAFRDRPAAQAFYAERQWDFEEAEYTFLERSAAQRPGQYPAELGPDYPARGESLLLERSRRQEQEAQPDAALRSADVLLQLAPQSTRGHDRLAYLHYQRGNLDRAAALLGGWHHLEPRNHVPLVRQAVIEQKRGGASACAQAIRQALELTHGPLRAAIALLGARLALAGASGGPAQETSFNAWAEAESLLQQCLNEDSDHLEALSYLAMVRSIVGDREGLAALAAAMNRPGVADPRFHYLAAVCHLAGGNYPQVHEAAGRAAGDLELAVECQYLIGWAHLHLKNQAAALTALRLVANTPSSPSANHAKALLGCLYVASRDYEDAIQWWNKLENRKRSAWQLDATLRATVFLAGLLAYESGRFELAADRFRKVGDLGLRDRRTDALLTLALVKAGQRLLYGASPEDAPPQSDGVQLEQQEGEESVQLLDTGSWREARVKFMATDVILEAIPIAQPVLSRFESAAALLQQALQTGCPDPHAAYLLAMAHKRQGKTVEARDALRKIPRPDANVFLQMGLLSLHERQFAQAEQEFARAWQMDPTFYEACYNLLMTRLLLGQLDGCRDLIPKALDLACIVHERVTAREEDERFLTVLQALLRSCSGSNGDRVLDPILLHLRAADETRLLQLLRSLGQLDVVFTLLKTLCAACPDSSALQEAYAEAVLVKGKQLLDRCAWSEAEQLLIPLARERGRSSATQTALFNLLGCCACLAQEFEKGVRYFSSALKLVNNDARLHQNLALAYEWMDQLPQADPQWNRYFDLVDRRLPAAPGRPDYVEQLAYESLSRLATCYSEKERWSSALVYVERARRFRPNDPEMLERLFHLYNHARCPDDARRVLLRLRELRPLDPQLDLYELDLIEVKNLIDVERLINRIEEILKEHPHDTRVEERAVGLVANVVPLMGNLCDQLTTQLNKVVRQVRDLPNYQINWSTVNDVMRDLNREFQKLRRITSKCLPLVKSQEHRRIIRDLTEHIDRKIEVCRSMRE